MFEFIQSFLRKIFKRYNKDEVLLIESAAEEKSKNNKFKNSIAFKMEENEAILINKVNKNIDVLNTMSMEELIEYCKISIKYNKLLNKKVETMEGNKY